MQVQLARSEDLADGLKVLFTLALMAGVPLVMILAST